MQQAVTLTLTLPLLHEMTRSYSLFYTLLGRAVAEAGNHGSESLGTPQNQKYPLMPIGSAPLPRQPIEDLAKNLMLNCPRIAPPSLARPSAALHESPKWE